ncbi:MAG: GNAT family N-acetyltransferase [Ruminococcus sp.]|nr:GNAT family N-acetyltransferase [Ruminococcus sp.]
MNEVRIIQGLDNAPEAEAIRREVFMEEQGFHNEFDDIDKRAYHAVIYTDGKASAVGRLFDGRSGWHIGRVAVRKEFRGAGLGALVVMSLEEKAASLGAECIRLSAQVRAQGFYERLGYTAEGEEYLDETCPHIAMYKML